ncbi:MAG: hypothetical protein AAGC47_11950 [Bacteroidota bacterium]
MLRYRLFFLSVLLSGSTFSQQTDFDQKKYVKEKKYEDLVSIEFNMGFGLLEVESVNMAGIQTSYFIELEDYFSIGAGTGLHLYESERFTPLFGEFRFLPGKGDTRLLLGSSIGTYYGWEEQIWDRYLNPFVGFSHKAYDNIELTISIGLVYTEYDVPRESFRLPNGSVSNPSGTEEVIGRFFSIRFGCRI